MVDENRQKLLNSLVKRYRVIRRTCDEQILERIKFEKDYYESFDWFCRLMQGKDPDALIEQAEKANFETEAIIARIDDALCIYAEQVMNESVAAWRKYDSLYCAYFSNAKPKIKDISERYRVKKSTTYRDIEEAKSRLFSILFGDDEN